MEDNTRHCTTEETGKAYSTTLLEALRRAGSPCSSTVIRNTAYVTLAVTRRGRARWSRAILLSSRKKKRAMLSITKSRRQRRRRNWSCMGPTLRELSQLVPGCRSLPLPELVSEAVDYIAALEMQVRAMAALAHALQSKCV